MQTLSALPDLFCELYDELDNAVFRQEADRWAGDSTLDSISTVVAHQAQDGALTTAAVRCRIDNSPTRQAMIFAVLRGLDRAFAEINPVAPTGSPLAPGLADLMIDVAARHRFDSGAHGLGGALIPRLVARQDAGQLPDDKREAFAAVLRVPPEHWNSCRFHVLPDEVLLLRHEVSAGLLMGCSPMIADPDEMLFDTDERDGRRFYRIGPADLPATRSRITEVLDRMDEAGIRIGVVPELTLSTEMLSAWQDAIRARKTPTKLQWIVVGSGNTSNGGRPRNSAVILDAKSGEELGRQDKIYPFNLSAQEVEDWGLAGRLGSGPVDEDIAPGDMLSFFDAGGMRVAVLVCEDLGRVVDFGQQIRSFGASHLIVPVFARPTKDRRWERSSANVHSRATGSTIVVANSRVMHSILGRDDGTGLVVWPGAGDALVLEAQDAGQVECFRLLADGAAELV